jgi:predicted PurR-regulated permease PerM
VLNDREAARTRSRAAWADLSARLATVTPSALGRALLTSAVIGGALAVVAGTWPALLPFFLGFLIAYTAMPLVDWLDRFMPRSVAAIATIVAVLAIIAGVFIVVIPPLTSALVDLSTFVPTADEIDRIVAEALGRLPESAREVAGPILVAVAVTAKDGLAGASGGLDDVVPAVLGAALGVAGAALGLLVLPVWLMIVLSSKRRAAAVVDRRVAAWIRPDFWAVVRMLDRAVGTYLRGYVMVAFLVGALTFVGLTVSSRLGGPTYPGGLALSVLAGAVQVIPEFGWVLGLVPAVLLLLIDPQRAAVYLAVYVGARWLSGTLVGRRFGEGRLGVHPIVLIPGIVALSQLGLIWLLLSAPILAFASDLVRYVHGRLSEPPRPAGVLPRDPLPTMSSTTIRPAVPAVYRQQRRVPASGASSATASANRAPLRY